MTNASAAPATSARRPRSRWPAGSSRSSTRSRTASTAPSTTGTTPIIQSRPPATNATRAPKKAMALATTAARYGSRCLARARPSDERVADEHRVQRAGQDHQLPPRDRADRLCAATAARRATPGATAQRDVPHRCAVSRDPATLTTCATTRAGNGGRRRRRPPASATARRRRGRPPRPRRSAPRPPTVGKRRPRERVGARRRGCEQAVIPQAGAPARRPAARRCRGRDRTRPRAARGTAHNAPRWSPSVITASAREQRPRRQRPVAVQREQHRNRWPTSRGTARGRTSAPSVPPRPARTASRARPASPASARQRRQRRQHADAARGAPPPDDQDEPRQHAAHLRERAAAARRRSR